MKKISILLICIIFLTGCTNLNKLSYDDIVDNFASVKMSANIYRTGYKYYLPDGMTIIDSTLYNETIKDNNYTYYLHVDVISYYNKVDKTYQKNDKAIYSMGINYDDKNGYVEINLVENDKYLVEIMYNYAKIEVIVDKDNCNRSMLSAINILNSIIYNDIIIANMLGDDILSFSEEDFDIFKTHSQEDDYIQIEDIVEDEDYQEVDTDLIN